MAGRMVGTPVQQVSEKELEQYVRDTNNNCLGILNELAKAWTDDSIQGYEKHSDILKLKNELNQLKESSADSKTILKKSNELKNAKVKVNDRINNFGKVMSTAKNGVESGSSILSIFGNSKAAYEVEVIGGSALAMGSSIFTLVTGTGDPLAAANTILSSIDKLIKFSKGQPNPHQQLALQIAALQHLVEVFYKALDERFDGVMQKLGQNAEDQFQQFITLYHGQSVIRSKLDVITHQAEMNYKNLRSHAEKINSGINELVEKLSNTKRQEFLKIRENINEQVALANETTTLGTGVYDAARAKIMGYTRTHGSGSSNVALIGQTVDISDVKQLNREINAGHPYFCLNTLEHCFEQLVPEAALPVLPDLMEKLIKQAGFSRNKYDVRTPMTLQHLLSSKPLNPAFQVESLFDTITLNQGEKILAIPFYIHGCWSLLVVDSLQKEAYYLAFAHQKQIAKKMQDILIHAGCDAQLVLHLHEIERLILNRNNSDAYVYLAIEKLINSENPQTWFEGVKTLYATTMPSLDLDHATRKSSFEAHAAPQNPLVLTYLGFKLLELNYSHHFIPGNTEEHISAPEITGIQEILKKSDSIYSLYHLFRNKDLFKNLFSQYQAALNEFYQQLEIEYDKFCETISLELNTKAYELAHEKLMSEAVSKILKEDNIEFNLYGSWFRKGYVQQVNIKPKHNASWRRSDNLDYGKGAEYNNGQKAHYVAAKNNFISARLTNFTRPQNEFTLYHESKIRSYTLPMMIYPEAAENPILPASDMLFRMLPQATQDLLTELMGRGYGYLRYTYAVNGNSLLFKIHFIEPNNQFQFSLGRYTINYDPKFYTGKEAIWFAWSGGCYADTLGSVTGYSVIHDTGGHNSAGNRHFTYGRGPVNAWHSGLVHALSTNTASLTAVNGFVPVLTIGNQVTNPEVNTFLTQYLTQMLAPLVTRYINEMKDKLITDNVLSQKANAVDAYYKLIRMYLNFLFPREFRHRQSLISQYFDPDFKYYFHRVRHENIVRNSDDLLQHFINKPGQYFGVAKVQAEVLQALTTGSEILVGGSEIHQITDLDILQDYLIQALDDMVPHVTQQRTESEYAQFLKKMNQDVDAGLNALQNELVRNANNPGKIIELAGLLKIALEEKANIQNTFIHSTGDGSRLLSGFSQRLMLDSGEEKKSDSPRSGSVNSFNYSPRFDFGNNNPNATETTSIGLLPANYYQRR